MIETFKITHGLYDKAVTADFLPIDPKYSENNEDKNSARGHKYTLQKKMELQN